MHVAYSLVLCSYEYIEGFYAINGPTIHICQRTKYCTYIQLRAYIDYVLLCSAI